MVKYGKGKLHSKREKGLGKFGIGRGEGERGGRGRIG